MYTKSTIANSKQPSAVVTAISIRIHYTYTEEKHGIPTPCPSPMQEVNPTPERKTAAGLVCNILSHCVCWLK